MTLKKYEENKSQHNDFVMKSFKEKLEHQTNKGIETYGVTIDKAIEDENVTIDDLINHLEEELIDSYVYFAYLKKVIRNRLNEDIDERLYFEIKEAYTEGFMKGMELGYNKGYLDKINK